MTQTELNLKTTKIQKFLNWMRGAGRVSSAEIIRYGINNYYTSVLRRARLYAVKGVLRRTMPEGSKLVYFEYIKGGAI